MPGSLAKKANNLSIPLTSLKFPPIIGLSYSTTRTKDWDDILTAHADETFARTWSMKDKKLGKHTFGFGTEGKKASTSGAVKVSNMKSLLYDHEPEQPSYILVCLRFCVWKLRFSIVLHRIDSYVQHAVRHSA